MSKHCHLTFADSTLVLADDGKGNTKDLCNREASRAHQMMMEMHVVHTIIYSVRRFCAHSSQHCNSSHVLPPLVLVLCFWIKLHCGKKLVI